VVNFKPRPLYAREGNLVPTENEAGKALEYAREGNLVPTENEAGKALEPDLEKKKSFLPCWDSNV